MIEKCAHCEDVAEILIPIKRRVSYGMVDRLICPRCLVAESGISVQSEVRLQ